MNFSYKNIDTAHTEIKNQIMLFHESGDKTSIPPADGIGLNAYFRAVQADPPTANLPDLLRNIMIRRTRRYVLKQWGKTDEDDRKYLLMGKPPEKKIFPR